MSTWNPANYGPPLADLLPTANLGELGPGRATEAVRRHLAPLSAADLFPKAKIADRDMALACLAGLWLAHGFLDDSHTISQQIETPTGSYWHAIMHRREGDFSNAKYWLRRVGRHPAFDEIAAALQAAFAETDLPADATFLAGGEWDPYRFIDLCESIARGRSTSRAAAETAATIEWQRLFDYCWRAAA